MRSELYLAQQPEQGALEDRLVEEEVHTGLLSFLLEDVT